MVGRIVAEFEFSDWQIDRPSAGRSFLISLTLHVAVTAAAFAVNPRPASQRFPEPRVAEIIQDEAQRLTWYPPKAALPAVAPAETRPRRPDATADKPRFRLPQPVTADDPNPQSLRQMVRTDAPDISIDQDVPLPNIVSWKAPKVEMPRFEPSPSQLIAPSTAGLPPLEAPKVEPVQTVDLALAQLEQTPRLRFQAERQQEPVPEQKPVEAEPAPEVVPEPDAEAIAELFQELPRMRYRRQENQPQAPAKKTIDAVPAPEIAAAQTPEVDPSQFQPATRLRYQSGATAQPAAEPARQAVADNGAPALADAAAAPGAQVDVSQFQELPKLRYQAGQGGAPAPAPGRRALGEVAAAPVPPVSGSAAPAGGIDASQLQPVARLRYQGSAPASGAAAPRQAPLGAVAAGPAPAVAGAQAADGAALAAVLGATPPPGLGEPRGRQPGGTGGDENIVAINVNPAERLPDTLPNGRRRGSFSAGPNAAPDGGLVGSKNPDSAAVRVPNLSIGGPREAPSAPAGGRATSGDGDGPGLLERFTRRVGIGEFGSIPPPHVDIVRDPPKIDLEDPFVGRPVYTMAVNMPNVTSYKGDWVMQFAVLSDEQEIGPGEDVEERLAFNDEDLTPPYPRIKVDPKYVPDAVRERIEGSVVFYCVIREDGSMTDLNLVKSLDDRLDAAARSALERWEFEAARKGGQRVAVETLVRIPFHLDPAVRMRY